VLAWLQAGTARLMLHRGFDRSKLEPWTLGLARYFAGDKGAGWSATRRLRGFPRTLARTMERHDVLVSPTVATPAPPLGHLATDVAFDVAFARIRAYAPFTPLYNAAGNPAISLPLGRSAMGLPIGVQFAAARGRDRTLLELALSLEEAQPWELLAPRAAWG
jgi:amidase